jgi:nitrous-oxide reductase
MKRPLLSSALLLTAVCGLFLLINSMQGCRPNTTTQAVVGGDAAARTYVKPGSYDEFYNFVSGGFSGQLSVYGLPSGRMLRNIPVFSVNPESGYGYSEETKDMLTTSHGFIPWDDSHHPELSQTDGIPDGKWCFINGNNTPRIALIDLGTFRTGSIIEIPNSAGNHFALTTGAANTLWLAPASVCRWAEARDVPSKRTRRTSRARSLSSSLTLPTAAWRSPSRSRPPRSTST